MMGGSDPNDEAPGTRRSNEDSRAVQASGPAREGDVAGAALPRQIGRYHIRQVLSSGGMGTVYAAVQEEPRRTVAVKLMKHGIASRSALRRFQFEAQILGRLKHPYIAEVYEAGTHDDGSGGVPFFAMEYVPGARTITEYARANSLGTRQRLELFAKVCEAVHHGHQKGIIHRDLKPGNILVDSRGDPKIIDFGVARATDSDMAITTLQTDIGQLVGTLQYMSPEQCAADPHDIDTRSDVYALGAVLYELLTGRLPYDVSAVAIHEAARVIRDETPARPSTLDRTLRGDVETIVLKAMEKERQRRYCSAEALAEDIGRYLRSEPIQARRPSMGYLVSRFARRHRGLVAAVATVFALLVAGLSATSLLLVRAVRAEVAAKEQKARADAALRSVLSLSDVKLVADYAAEADELWPAHPQRIASLEAWLEKARELVERLPGHEAELAALRQRATSRTADPAVQWQHQMLAELVERLGAFAAPVTGTVAHVEERLAFARTIEERSVTSPGARAAWAVASGSISDRDACPRYGGLAITPQIGLLPLERNPKTGLWEFWHIQTGARPQANPSWPDGAVNRWIVTEDTGLVFVLIPGGTFRMGAERPPLGVEMQETPEGFLITSVTAGTLAERMGLEKGDILRAIDGAAVENSAVLAGALRHLKSGASVTATVLRGGAELELSATAERGIDSPNVDPDASDKESPVHDVALEPFFLSKYEMTQGQWLRFVGQNPSRYAAGQSSAGTSITAAHPVEQVSWDDADGVLRKLGLLLPTESQWEYACRAGTGSVWHTGGVPGTLAGHANIADEGSARFYSAGWNFEEGFADGFGVHAPVGSFTANAFGLYDVHGNVWELCRDHYASYGTPARAGDGLRDAPGVSDRALRGGSFGNPAVFARSATRFWDAPAYRDFSLLGLRPSRFITE